MCTSIASKPARSNAAAISSWPLTPCSRSTATRGRVPLLDERRGDVLGRIEAQHWRDARVGFVEQRVVFLLGAGGVVAQTLRCASSSSPTCAAADARRFEDRFRRRGDVDLVVARSAGRSHASTPTDRARAALRSTASRSAARTWITAPSSSLNSARIVGLRDGRWSAWPSLRVAVIGFVLGRAQHVEVQRHAQWPANAISHTVAQQTAVGTVVVSEQLAVGVERLDRARRSASGLRRRRRPARVADLLRHLRKDASRPGGSGRGRGRSGSGRCCPVRAQLRRQGLAHVVTGAKAETISDTGEVTSFRAVRRSTWCASTASPCRPEC